MTDNDVVRYSENMWAVESMDSLTGEFYSAVFRGPGAESRARSYAAWRTAAAVEPPSAFSGTAREVAET